MLFLLGGPLFRIVSDVESDSYQYARLIDDTLKPISNLHPSYIKNTFDFLDELRDQTCEKDVWLVTIDIESLYTNGSKDIDLLLSNSFQNYYLSELSTQEF